MAEYRARDDERVTDDERAKGTRPPPAPGPAQVPPWAPRLMTVLLLGLILLWWMSMQTTVDTGAVVSYTTFLELVEDDAVTRVTLESTRLTGTLGAERTLQTVDDEAVATVDFVTQLPSADDPTLLALLREHGVEVTVRPPAPDRTWWWSLLLGVAPFLLLFGFWIWMAMRMRGAGPEGLLSIGRSGARLYDHTREQVTFEDVAGARGAKQELREIIDFLRTPERFRRLGAEIPRGVLLVGPPGTGKTLLAKAVAGEAGVPFFSITGSDFLEMFVGVGPKRVRDLFESAKAVAPSIIFIDELDAIGGRRGLGIFSGGTDERERTLNQLLSEMSGFEPNENVIVMAATNRPDVLDAALLRPGRFDRRIMVDLPMQEDREQILRLHARHKPLAPDVDLKKVAAGTPGFSGADLRNLLNEAAILAARENADAVTGDDIEQARDKILMGLEREGLALTERERKFLSYHEAGHAVLAAVLPHTDPLHKVTIVPRGRAMGVTQQLPEREKYVYEREYVLDRVVVMMGGRAAEEIVFQTATSGAEDDLRQASMLVRRMVQDWGMSDALGPFVAERPREQPFLGGPSLEPREYSDETARRVDEAVEHILDECYERAVETLRAHRGDLDRVAARLLEVEELSGEDVGKLLEARGARQVASPPESVRPATPEPGPVSPAGGGDGDSPRAQPPEEAPRPPDRRKTSRSPS